MLHTPWLHSQGSPESWQILQVYNLSLERFWSSLDVSNKCMRNFKLGIICGGALLCWDQNLAASWVDLWHTVSQPAAPEQKVACVHSGRTKGRKEGRLWNQEFLKRKIVDKGTKVDMVSKFGMWSEVGLGCGSKEVFGTMTVWSKLTKALSSFARMGRGCWIDQVKLQPRRGIPKTPS